MTALILGATACGGPALSANPEPVAVFAFVRDEADILTPGQRTDAERALREIAQRTGVYGVVVTVDEGQELDPPRIYRPIVAEVTALGGEALITICLSADCGRSAGTAHTDGLDDAVAAVGAEAHPPTQGLNRGLRDWLGYVAAVAAARR